MQKAQSATSEGNRDQKTQPRPSTEADGNTPHLKTYTHKAPGKHSTPTKHQEKTLGKVTKKAPSPMQPHSDHDEETLRKAKQEEAERQGSKTHPRTTPKSTKTAHQNTPKPNRTNPKSKNRQSTATTSHPNN